GSGMIEDHGIGTVIVPVGPRKLSVSVNVGVSQVREDVVNSRTGLRIRLAVLGMVSLVFLGGCAGTAGQPPLEQPSPEQPPPEQRPPPPLSGPGPISVAVAPDPSGNFGKFAYVANYRSNKIAMYTIDAATGALTSIGTIDAGLSPSSIAI